MISFFGRTKSFLSVHFSRYCNARWRMTSRSAMLEPDAHNHEIYMTEFARWRELYANALQLLDRGLVKSMFQVDGTFTEEQLKNPWKLQ